MHTTLYMAISADGFIANASDETPWSNAEWQAFRDFVKSCDAVLLGRRTYEIMRSQNEFVEDAKYFVATNTPSLDTGRFPTLSIKTKSDLPHVEKLGVIGGGDLNGRLAKIGALDDIILDVELLLFGEGKRLFGDHDVTLDITLISTRTLGTDTIQMHYQVNNVAR